MTAMFFCQINMKSGISVKDFIHIICTTNKSYGLLYSGDFLKTAPISGKNCSQLSFLSDQDEIMNLCIPQTHIQYLQKLKNHLDLYFQKRIFQPIRNKNYPCQPCFCWIKNEPGISMQDLVKIKESLGFKIISFKISTNQK